MSKSTTCDVFVKLPHGIVMEEGFGMAMDGKPATDSPRVILQHGLNEDMDRACIERWLKHNRQLAAVKRGDIRILEDDVIAYDSGS
jgi:hypothetical protein